MSRRWLVLRLEAPLMAFGGVAIDQIGPVRDFPAASMLTGLIGNALGLHWSDRAEHQAIQDRLIFAARRPLPLFSGESYGRGRRKREGVLLTDTQNAQLAKTDKGWTTSGEPEGRAGATYDAPHRKTRDYHADLSVHVVLRLDQEEEPPTIDALAEAIDRPARPLFFGRKSCLPSTPMLSNGPDRWVMGNTAYEALHKVPGEGEARAQWPMGQGPEEGKSVDRIVDLADIRNWGTGLHGGSRQVVEGRISPEKNE